MLLPVMRTINNYFIISEETGDFSLYNNQIKLNKEYLIEQYILLTGSVLHNGIYKIFSKVLISDGVWEYILIPEDPGNAGIENFTGTIYGLSIPKDFIALADEINQFIDKSGQTGAFTSEKFFNDYSYTLATNENGAPMSWQDIFRSRLNKFRKMFSEVRI